MTSGGTKNCHHRQHDKREDMNMNRNIVERLAINKSKILLDFKKNIAENASFAYGYIEALIEMDVIKKDEYENYIKEINNTRREAILGKKS